MCCNVDVAIYQPNELLSGLVGNY